MTRSTVPAFDATDEATASSSTSLTASIRIAFSVMLARRSSAGAWQRQVRHSRLFRGQLTPQHFSDKRLGQLGAEHDLDRDLVWREVRAAVVHQLLDGRLGGRPEDDECFHDFALR